MPPTTRRWSPRADELLEQRLVEIDPAPPQFAAALRAYRTAQRQDDHATAEGLAGWLAGQPHVAASVKRVAGIKGDVDHFAALSFLPGLLLILKDSGYSGLVLVLDEIETLQRVRGDVREKGLNALRQLIDEIDGGRFPGLYLLVTGTPAFFDGPQGVQRLEPLAQRLHVDFRPMPASTIRARCRSACPVRPCPAAGGWVRRSVTSIADGTCVGASVCDSPPTTAMSTTWPARSQGKLGGKVGIAPRLFLKKLVADVLDRIDQFADFDPRRHYR